MLEHLGNMGLYDRVQVGDYAGDVIDIDIFQFTLMESGTSGVSKDMRTGRLVKISNSAVFTEPQVNFTKGWFEYIRNTIEVSATFESNWKKAGTILEEIVTAESQDTDRKAKDTMGEASGKYMVLDMGLGATAGKVFGGRRHSFCVSYPEEFQ